LEDVVLEIMEDQVFKGNQNLDEDEKKRFTPSELLLYKVAVEYRYITVHTGTYLYVLVHTGTYLYILVHTRYILEIINALAM